MEWRQSADLHKLEPQGAERSHRNRELRGDVVQRWWLEWLILWPFPWVHLQESTWYDAAIYYVWMFNHHSRGCSCQSCGWLLRFPSSSCKSLHNSLVLAIRSQKIMWQRSKEITALQGSTKLVSDSPGLLDFSVVQADFSGHLPDEPAWLKSSMACSTVDWTLAKFSFPDLGVPFRNLGVSFRNLVVPFRNLGVPFRNLGVSFRNIGVPFRNLGVPFRNLVFLFVTSAFLFVTSVFLFVTWGSFS